MKKPVREKTVPVESASAILDAKVRELGDWRGKMLAKVRELIIAAAADYGPDYLARVRSPADGYMCVAFSEDVELSMRIS